MGYGEPFEVAVDGTTIAGDRWPADRPSVLFLHSGVSDSRAWQAVIDPLEGEIDAISYDQRGHGRTSLGSVPFRRLDDALAVLDDQQVERTFVVGNSMGGGCALDLALTAPDRVAGLLLLGTAISGAPEYEDDRVDAATMVLSERIDRAYEDGDVDGRVRFETWLWLDGPAQPEGRVSGRVRRLAEGMARGISESDEINGKSGLDTWDRVEEIAAPVIVGIGEYDIPILNERCEVLAGRLPNAVLRVVTGSAHGPSLDAPDQVVTLIHELLATGR